MRSLMSEGRIKYTTVMKGDDGKMVPVEVLREGPTGLITTTTWNSLHAENETRMLSVTVRDDAEQTRDVLASLAAQNSGVGGTVPDIEQWHAMQSWLENAGGHEAVIPFAGVLASECSAKAVRLRRDFGKIMNLIKANAILHQCNRQYDEHGRVMATLADYAAIYGLISELLDEGVEASVSASIRETVQAVAKCTSGGDPVSITKLGAALHLDKASASRRARVAIELGYLTNMETQRGRPSKLVVGEGMPEETPVLPTPDRLKECVVLHGLAYSATAQQSGGGDVVQAGLLEYVSETNESEYLQDDEQTEPF